MKWLIASDIHGSSLYCRRLLEAWDRERADRMLLLGDVLYHGPRNDLPEGYAPKEVIALLNARKNAIYCVRGNCEAEVDQMVLEFPVMADYLLLPVGEKCIYATHGHTHIPVCREHEDYVYCNPGSVSIPKENSPRSYMVMEDGLFTWKTLEGEAFHVFDWRIRKQET